MIDEARAVQADLAARATFAKDGDTVHDTRHVIAEAIIVLPDRPSRPDPAIHTAAKLALAAADDSIEVG